MKTRATIPGLLLAIFLGITPLHTHQYWWHLSIGRLIDRFSSIPAANHFVYTAPADAPSLIQPWIAQWILFFLHDIGSIELVLLSRNILASITLIATTFFACKLARKRAHNPTIPTIAAALATIPLAATIDATPILFALPLFAILLATATTILPQTTTPKKHLALLLIFPAITTLWANLAPAYITPILLAAACTAIAALTHKNRTQIIAWSTTTILSFAALFTTPHKLNILQDLTQNLIPSTPTLIPLLILTLIPATALIPRKPTTQSLPKLTLPILLLLAALAIAAQPFTEPQAEFAAKANLQNARDRWPHKGHLNAEHPIDCIEALRKTGKEFRVLHPREFAGIIIFRLQNTTPKPAVLLDPRSEFISPQTLQLHELLDTPGIGRGLIQQHKLNAAILNNHRQPNLIADLDRDPAWYILNQDDHTTCFYKL